MVGVTLSVEDIDLEPTVCMMLQDFGLDITGERTEAFLCRNKQCDINLARFWEGKILNMSIEKTSKLRKPKPSELDLPNSTELCINENLCPYYMGLWNHCKNLTL